MIDLHSHILPQMDDGSRSVDESLRMLAALAAQSVTEVAATPHFMRWRTARSGFWPAAAMRGSSWRPA